MCRLSLDKPAYIDTIIELYDNMSSYLHVFQPSQPIIEQAKKSSDNKDEDENEDEDEDGENNQKQQKNNCKKTIKKFSDKITEVLDYITEKNKQLKTKIKIHLMSVWYKDSNIKKKLNLKLFKKIKISAWNSTVMKIYLGLSVHKMNAFNNMFNAIFGTKVFQAKEHIKKIEDEFKPQKDGFTLVTSTPTVSKISRKNINKNEYKLVQTKLYNINAFETISRNCDALFNNNITNFSLIPSLKPNTIIATMSTDACTCVGMNSMKLTAESIATCCGSQSSSAYHSTITTLGYGESHDKQETFNEFYNNNTTHKYTIQSLFKNPIVVTIILSSNNHKSRYCSSLVLAYDTKIHQELNRSRKQIKNWGDEDWEKDNPELKINHENLREERLHTISNINSCDNKIMGIGEIASKYNSKSKKNQKSWTKEYDSFCKWISTITPNKKNIPIKGVTENNNKIYELINNMCKTMFCRQR